jgi:hypothetical protein
MRPIQSRLCAALVISPSILFAQSCIGTIVGSTKDPSGALIRHATVPIINQQTSSESRPAEWIEISSSDQ